MTTGLKIALYQQNTRLGDLSANMAGILDARSKAHQQGADLLIGPEMGVLGYPPEDLVLRDSVVEASMNALDALCEATRDGGPALLVGAPMRSDSGRGNAAILIDDGQIVGITRKHHLPNYGVFDEQRIFAPGPLPEPITFRGVQLGVMVCEDMWFADVSEALTDAGADMLIVINASPFEHAFQDHSNKATDRQIQARCRVSETGRPLIYVNQVGAQDEIVFDGGSFVMAPDGDLWTRLPQWREALSVTDWTQTDGQWRCTPATVAPSLCKEEEVYCALVTGLRDYVEKNGFPGIVLGLSGGIDSALVAALGVDALGPDRVRCFMLPSPFTSTESLEDAKCVADLLGARLDTIDIRPGMDAVDAMLEPIFQGVTRDVTEENIQARLRGLLLMAVSNKYGPMLVATGNKSEMAVGYATLYGDMCGGFALLKDVYKTHVFALCRWRNAHRPDGLLGPDGPVMPDRVITKPPTAELRPDQKDEDSLPPYAELDAILSLLIEGERGVRQAAQKGGFDIERVRKVWTMLVRAEYKRRQAPPGPKVTRMAFGRDRRYPITSAYKG